MYCTNCGNEVAEKAIACTKCGIPPRSEKKFCYNCGVEVNEKQTICVKCGVGLVGGLFSTKGRKKTIAAIWALTIGSLGVHKFYNGSWGWGIIYIATFWTAFPLLLGVIEGITYLTMDDAKYDAKYNNGENHPFKW